jgi:hypothetical protein
MVLKVKIIDMCKLLNLKIQLYYADVKDCDLVINVF